MSLINNMAARILISIVLILAGTAATAYYLHFFDKTYSIEIAMIDRTDSFRTTPQASDIITPLQLREHPWNGVRLRVRTIEDVDYSKTAELRLPYRMLLLSNPEERKNEIAAFSRQVDSAISIINGQKTGLSKSSIYRPVIAELNWLAAQQADKKSLLIYTNGFENSFFSVYNAADRRLLKTSPELVRKRFEKEAKPNDLSGITVYFIFQPKDHGENELYTQVVNIYRQILLPAGAKIVVAANVPLNDD